jgi:ABC-type multidrug transport system ATPase subunit
LQAGMGLLGISPGKHRFIILDNISGAILPGRMTLLLGPPGAGKSTLLKTLANKMQHEGWQV